MSKLTYQTMCQSERFYSFRSFTVRTSLINEFERKFIITNIINTKESYRITASKGYWRNGGDNQWIYQGNGFTVHDKTLKGFVFSLYCEIKRGKLKTT